MNKSYGYKLGAVSKNILFIIIVVLFLVGCNSDKSNLSGETEEGISSGGNVEIATNNSENELNENVEIEPEVEEVEILPLKRVSDLSGGRKVVSTTGQIWEEVVLEEEVEDGVFRYVMETEAFEFRRNYDIHLRGSSKPDIDIVVYIESVNSEIDPIEAGTYFSKPLDSEGNLSEILIFPFESSGKGVVVIEALEALTFESIQVKRHVGEIVFSDEFEYDGLPDEEIWGYETGGNGWGNGELQYYTGKDLDNAKVEGGHLIITAIEEKFENSDYTSARLRSSESFTYGRYEIRAKLPKGRGTWPAIWMLPTGNNFGGWPNSGEIDIMEHVGFDMDVVHGSLHMADFNFRKGWHPTGEMMVPKVDEEFHNYILEWTPYQIDIYMDDFLYVTYKNDGQGPKHWPFSEKFYLLMNIAVGGAWGGQEGIDPVYPQEMAVDYVRVYELEDQVYDYSPPDAIEKVRIEVNGPAVQMDWEPVEDDYLVSDYIIAFKDETGEIVETATRETEVLIMNLEQNTGYKVELAARDEFGNVSNKLIKEVVTGECEYYRPDTWISPEQICFMSGGQVVDEEDWKTITGIEDGHMVGYGFDLPEAGNYILEIEVSGRLFDGEISIKDGLLNELTTVTATKTGEATVYHSVFSQPISLEKGKQMLILEALDNGYQIRQVRLVKN